MRPARITSRRTSWSRWARVGTGISLVREGGRRDGQGADVHFEIDIDGIDDDQEESSSGDDGLRSIDAALPTSRC